MNVFTKKIGIHENPMNLEKRSYPIRAPSFMHKSNLCKPQHDD